MSLSPSKINSFLFFKLPSAWWCGVRLKSITKTTAIVKVKHRWLNQNPFKSMYFAVQAMASELSTGALVMKEIRESGKSVSMLVANNNATFTKKATGVITFTCNNGDDIKKAIADTVKTGEGQTCWMKSVGINDQGVVVSTFNFEWTVRLKSKK